MDKKGRRWDVGGGRTKGEGGDVGKEKRAGMEKGGGEGDRRGERGEDGLITQVGTFVEERSGRGWRNGRKGGGMPGGYGRG